MATTVRKSDYYIGALLFNLVNKVIHPMVIIDCSNNAKIIKFETDTNHYSVFVKYCGKPKSEYKNMKKWDFNFTQKETDTLYKMDDPHSKCMVALVCSVDELTSTEISVLPLTDSKRCLGQDSKNTTRRITVSSIKGSHTLQCYGTAICDKQAIKTSRNLDKHFV